MKNLIFLCFLSILYNCTGFTRLPDDNYMAGNETQQTYTFDSIEDFKVYFRNNATRESEASGICNSLTTKGFEEFQYLIINKDNRVIYISTTPSNSNIENRNYFFKNKKDTTKTSINSYYFNSFLVGKLKTRNKRNIIEFKNIKENVKWNFEEKNDTINVTSIDIFKKKYKKSDFLYQTSIIPYNSIDTGFSFKEVKNFDNFYFCADNKKKVLEDFPKVENLTLIYKNNALDRIHLKYNNKLTINGRQTSNIFEQYSGIRIKYTLPE